MNLISAQESIKKLSLKRGDPGFDWATRAASLLKAFLPILACPDAAALRGDREGLLDVEELIRRANEASTDVNDMAWVGVRKYLMNFPGLAVDGTGKIVFGGTASVEIVREKFDYITMQFSEGGNYGE